MKKVKMVLLAFLMCFAWQVCAVNCAFASDLAPDRKLPRKMTTAELVSNLETLDGLLSSEPGNTYTWILSQSVIGALYLEGNEAIPLLARFQDNKSICHRQFAMQILIQIDTSESMAIVLKRFKDLYHDKKASSDAEILAIVGSYYSPQMDKPKMADYWEARDILREMIRINSQYAIPLCMQVYRDSNGMGAIAAKYLWRKKGKTYGKEFMGYAKIYGDNEAFYTFGHELADIYFKQEQDEYPDIDSLKKLFKKQAIEILSDKANCNDITTELLLYMGAGEQDWFAENWIELYKSFKSRRCGNISISSDFYRAAKPNKKTRNNMYELKSIMSETDYQRFENKVKRYDAEEAYREKNHKIGK